MKLPADQDPVLYSSILAGSYDRKTRADQDPLLFNIMLTRFFWYKVVLIRIQCYITTCWPGSYDIKSPADQDPV